MPIAKWQLVKLDFQNNPVHFGEAGIGLEETSESIHSDTLFSAWVSSYAKLYPRKIEGLFDQFLKPNESITLPFQLSSTFVYGAGQSGDCYYLPTLFQRPSGYPIDDLKFSKAFKKLKFVPRSIWQRWYQRKGFSEQDIAELLAENGELAKAGTFRYGKMFSKQTLPKVAVDRIHHGTNFYQTGFTYFQAGAGLYFLFQMAAPDEELFQQLQSSFDLLADEGIGGERSSGAGRFIATWSDLPAEWNAVVNASIEQPYHALISLFWDDPALCASLVANENARYQLLERGGWMSARSGRQLRRKFVRMFTEGSVFPELPQGQLAVVTPEELRNKNHHPIYRSGVSLGLPVAL